jgi:putative DNA primase/helicase
MADRERADATVRVELEELRRAEAAGVQADVAKRLAAEVVRNSEVPEDANHLELAQAFVHAMRTRSGGWEPVAYAGQLYRVKGPLWVPMSVDHVGLEIAHIFAGRAKLCRRGADFASIARLVMTFREEPDFFDSAPPGVAGPSAFCRVTEAGEIRREPLTPAHRQRSAIAADPDDEVETPRFDALLDHAFGAGEEGEAQRRLLQQVFGLALARALWRYRLAVLLWGATTSGKSTLLSVLSGMFPRELVGATNPQRWDNEYYAAGLAGKAINVVGELDPDQPIPGGAFKSVVGCDVVEGRHPTHRPFSFVSTAANFFNTNRMPPTVDRSDAFFARWRVLHFRRPVQRDQVVVGLAERILEEEAGGVAAWMLRGAADAISSGGVIETAEHRAAIARWRAANNSALAFLLDDEACQLDDTETPGAVLYDAYRTWAKQTGVRTFGRTGFYEAIDEGGGRLGVERVDSRVGVVIRGVRLR